MTPGEAAAVVCWRPGRDPGRDPAGPPAVEVLAGGDRSTLPRGTPKSRETLPQTAVRSLKEAFAGHATGPEHQVPRLARPLGTIEGTAYWAARVPEPDAAHAREESPSGDSPGDLAWIPAERANDVLASPGDRAAVAAAAAAAAHGQLDTRPLLVVRHATARPRSRWHHADADRPLEAAGVRQSLALVALLECWRPEYLLSSPWRRCVDTLLPYAGARHLRIIHRGGLSEHAHRAAPQKAARHLHATLARPEATLICTHRPVLPTLLEQLGLCATAEARTALPDEDPYLAPAEVLVAHVAVPGETVGGETVGCETVGCEAVGGEGLPGQAVPGGDPASPYVVAVERHRPVS